MTDQRWFYRRGELARGDWQSVVDASTPGWAHTGIRVAELASGAGADGVAAADRARATESLALDETGIERIVVPLAGSFTVSYSQNGINTDVVLNGRSSVFDGPTDVLYLSSAATATVRGSGRVAVATSPTTEVRPTRYISATETPVELRGAGASSRQVHNFGTPQALDAARLIVCEVITPSQNWSSYPPHKHDENLPGHETRLEEIYYFESAPTRADTVQAPDPGASFGMFSTYSSPAGDIEIDARVQTGDIALVPYGYHGPAVAAPGYDLYYLNVMAGPDSDRAWLISDDPAHAWVRESWNDQAVDSRLPYTKEAATNRPATNTKGDI